MFKRPPLSNGNHLVNGSLALCLLFLAASCDNSSNEPDTTVEAEATEEVSDPLEETEAEPDGLSLPAVWASNNLDQPIRDIALAGGLGSLIAVTFESGDIQILNFEGERVTEAAQRGVSQLADGQYGLIAGTPLTVFPGIDEAGGLNAYLFGGEIEAPIAFPLDIGSAGRVKGLCAARPLDETDGIMRLAYWTEGAASRLESGRLVEVGDSLVFLADEPVEADRPITACILQPTGATVFSEPVIQAINLERNGRQNLITLDRSGGLTLLSENGKNTEVNIRDGITVRVPSEIASLSGTGDARGGGYPGGLIVLGGAISSTEHRAVLVDPSDLTLTAFEVPALSGQD